MTDMAVEPGKAAVIYARKFYELLEKRAKTEYLETDDLVAMPQEILVFRGSLTDVFKELKVSQTFYSKIRAILIEYDCVTYLQRGTKAYDSVLLLNHPPPEEISLEVLTRPGEAASIAVLADRLEDVERSVEIFTKWRETTGGINIGDAFRDMERRLAKLEGDAKNQ